MFGMAKDNKHVEILFILAYNISNSVTYIEHWFTYTRVRYHFKVHFAVLIMMMIMTKMMMMMMMEFCLL